MAYLGLVDEEYDDLDRAQSDSRPYRGRPEPAPPVASSRYDQPEGHDAPATQGAAFPAFRPEPAPPVASSRYDEPEDHDVPATKVTPMQPRRAISVVDSGTIRPQVRPMGSGASPGSVRVVPSDADVQIVQPTSFNEGKEIAHALNANSTA